MLSSMPQDDVKDSDLENNEYPVISAIRRCWSPAERKKRRILANDRITSLAVFLFASHVPTAPSSESSVLSSAR